MNLRHSRLLMRRAWHNRRWCSTTSLAPPDAVSRCFTPVLSCGTIRLSGPDAGNFLQGMISNDVRDLDSNTSCALHAGILNSKGRLICDAIVSKIACDGSYVVEVDRSLVPSIMKHFKMFKLRKKVELVDASDEIDSWSIMSPVDMLGRKDELEQLRRAFLETDLAQHAYIDPRWDGLGLRVLGPSVEDIASFGALLGDLLPQNSGAAFEGTVLSTYSAHLAANGIAEGAVLGGRIPLECNLEKLNGVSFSKGCYQGQELTARTHHHGTVRKRLLPVRVIAPQFETPSRESQSEPFLLPRYLWSGENVELAANEELRILNGPSDKRVGKLISPPLTLLGTNDGSLPAVMSVAMVRLADLEAAGLGPSGAFVDLETGSGVVLRAGGNGLPPWWGQSPSS